MTKRLPNGNLLVPVRAEAEDDTIGDAWVEIGPDHPDYQKYLDEALRQARILERPSKASECRPVDHSKELRAIHGWK